MLDFIPDWYTDGGVAAALLVGLAIIFMSLLLVGESNQWLARSILILIVLSPFIILFWPLAIVFAIILYLGKIVEIANENEEGEK